MKFETCIYEPFAKGSYNLMFNPAALLEIMEIRLKNLHA